MASRHRCIGCFNFGSVRWYFSSCFAIKWNCVQESESIPYTHTHTLTHPLSYIAVCIWEMWKDQFVYYFLVDGRRRHRPLPWLLILFSLLSNHCQTLYAECRFRFSNSHDIRSIRFFTWFHVACQEVHNQFVSLLLSLSLHSLLSTL